MILNFSLCKGNFISFRQENDARLKTLHELESLRSNQKQTDNSVKKIKRDLEEINRNIAEKENKTVVDFQTPAEQWKREVGFILIQF